MARMYTHSSLVKANDEPIPVQVFSKGLLIIAEQFRIDRLYESAVYICSFALLMLNRYLTYYKPALQFVVFCAILSMCWILGGSMIEMINQKITGMSSMEIANLKEYTPALSNQLKLINSLLLLLTLLLPAILFAYLAYPNAGHYLGWTSPLKKHHLLWGLTLILIAIPFTGLLEQWSLKIPGIDQFKSNDEAYDRMARGMLQGGEIRDLLINLLAMCLIPAVVEELFFRGCLQQLLLRWMRKTPLIAILTVALIFSAFHGQVTGLIPRFFLGALLGLAYYFSGSIWVSIVMHFINNAFTIVLFYLFQNKTIQLDPMHLPEMSIWFGLGSGLAVFGIIYLFNRDRIVFVPVEVDKEPTIDELQ